MLQPRVKRGTSVALGNRPKRRQALKGRDNSIQQFEFYKNSLTQEPSLIAQQPVNGVRQLAERQPMAGKFTLTHKFRRRKN